MRSLRHSYTSGKSSSSSSSSSSSVLLRHYSNSSCSSSNVEESWKKKSSEGVREWEYPGDMLEERRLYGTLIDRVSEWYDVSKDDVFRYTVSEESHELVEVTALLYTSSSECVSECVSGNGSSGGDHIDSNVNESSSSNGGVSECSSSSDGHVGYKGLGVVALRDLTAGQLIIEEKPLVTFTRVQGRNSPILPLFHSLTHEDQVSYIGLSDSYHYTTHHQDCSSSTLTPLQSHTSGSSNKTKTLEGIKLNNCITLSTPSLTHYCNDTQAAIFLLIHRMNHSCIPNANFTYNPTTHTASVRTMRSVKKGEEICISYFSGEFLTSKERQEYLLHYLIDPCMCPVCAVPNSDTVQSDERRMLLLQYQASVMTAAIEIRTMRESLVLHYGASKSKSECVMSECESKAQEDLAALVSSTLITVGHITRLLDKERLTRADNLNWLNLLLYWVTDDPVYMCLTYLYNVQYTGQMSSEHYWHMIPIHIRASGKPPSHYTDGRECDYEDFQDLKCAFDTVE